MPPSVAAGVLIELRNVTRTYGAIQALRGVTLDLAAGSVTAVTGPSGSGKSTLLNLIGGLDAPTSGDVHVLGADLGGMDETARSLWRRRAVGFVFQAFHLLPTLTAFDNVALPLHVQGRGAREIRSVVERALADVGLSPRVSHLPDELSGGERQRVAIARALAAAPSLLLADEPTGNLDGDTGDAILTLLLDVTRARGATLVLVTHNEQAAARCERRITLADGRVIGDAAVQDRRAASA
jgi:putative ABC transport system ATP-binding protein